MLEPKNNITIFRRLIEEGFTGGDVAVVEQTVALECVEHQRGSRSGAEGVKETIRTLHRWFSDFRLEIDDLVAAGDMVWARNTGSGVNTGSIMGMPPTGKPMSITVFDVARFVDGRIVEHWGVPDQLGMLLQLGLVPRPQPAGTPAGQRD